MDEEDSLEDESYDDRDPEQDLLNKILDVMMKRPGMVLGVTKGFKYKGFSDNKQSPSIIKKPFVPENKSYFSGKAFGKFQDSNKMQS